MAEVTTPIRVLIAASSSVLREALRLLVQSQPNLHIVGEAATCADALALAPHERPDIVLLDFSLEAGSCLDCIVALGTGAPAARIILFGVPADTPLAQRAVILGAQGLVRTQQPAPLLLKAIECVHSGEVWIERALMAEVLREMAQHLPSDGQGAGQAINQPINPDGSESGKIAILSQREHEIIKLIGEGLKNRQIAERLGISERTVHSHLASIFQKLGVADRLELAIFAYRTGLLKPFIETP